MDLSICIVSMNNRNVIEECISSIYNNPPSKYSFEVIVVDNCSIDGTQVYLEEISSKYSNLIVIINQISLNFAQNNNKAIKCAQGSIVLILNPDTLIKRKTLNFMVDYMLSNAKVGASSCKLLYPDGSFQDSARRFIKVKYLLASRFKVWGIAKFESLNEEYIMSKEYDTVPKNVDYILGACMFVKREVFTEIGLFDERFLLYAEDTDLCYRIWKSGWSVTYVPNVEIIHIYARTGAKKIFSKAAIYQLYTALLFYSKHYWKITK